MDLARWSRRRWLAASVALASLRLTRARGQDLADAPLTEPTEEARLALIRARANQAGLPELTLREGARYLTIGTAPADFSKGALRLCEELADDYLAHFTTKKFEVEAPSDRMAIVSMADQGEFSRFLGIEQPPDVTGIFEIEPNYLVLYDGRTGSPAGPHAERANSITLFHEATHQLTFNTGLLARTAEVPLAILEGLAMYGEVRRPDGRARIGAINQERLAVIRKAFREGGRLFPITELIASDDLFNSEETVQMAYAQSWLLVYAMLKENRSVERLRSYLDVLRGPADVRDALGLVRAHLGEPDQLDAFLQGTLSRLVRGR